MSESRSVSVSSGGNVIFKKAGIEGLCIVGVEAPVGARLTVNLDLIAVDPASDAFTKPRIQEDESVLDITYVPCVAEEGAISYRRLATVTGTPPKFSVAKKTAAAATSLF